MNVKEIGKEIKNAVDNKELSLSSIARHAPAFQTLLDNFTELSGLRINEVTVRQENGGDRLRITGQANWKDRLPAKVRILIEENGEAGPRVQASAEIADDQALPVPGLTWFQLLGGNLEVVSDPAEADIPVSGQFACSMLAGETRIPLSAQLPGTEGIALQAKLSDLVFPGLADLANLAGGRAFFDLPEQIDQLGEVSLHELNMLFQKGENNGDYSLADLEFHFGPANSWDLIPGLLSMNNIRVATGFSDPLKQNRAFRGAIRGEARIGELPIELMAGKDQPDDPWLFASLIARIGLGELTRGLLEGLKLPPDMLDLHFENVALNITPENGAFTLKTNQAGDQPWNFPLGRQTLTVDGLEFEINRSEGQMGGLLRGNTRLFGIAAGLNAVVDQDIEFTATIPSISMLALIDQVLDDFTPPDGLPDFQLENVAFAANPSAGTFSFQSTSTEGWEIPIGPTGLKTSGLEFMLQRERSNAQLRTSGNIGGMLSLGGVQLDLRYRFPGDFVLKADIPEVNLSPLLQDLAGTEGLLGLPAPPAVLNVALSDIQLMVAPQQKSCSLSGASPLGKTEILINKNQQGKWVFVAGFVPPSEWKFSTIDGSLRALDDLRFDDALLLLSSDTDNDIQLSIVDLPAGVSGAKGLNIYLNLDMSGLGIDDLMDIDRIQVSAAIGPNPAALMLIARLDGSFAVTENVAFGDMQFRLRPAPTNFSLGVAGAMMVTLDESPLKFLGMMEVRPLERSAAFSATMLGTWNEPFDVRGLAVSDLALELGMGIVPPPATVAPIIGLAGSIRIGSFNGSAAVKFDSVMPTKSMIAASFDRLVLQEVIQQFCRPEVFQQIPADIRNTVLTAGMEEVEVYVVPQPTTIGALAYEQGFRFQGKIQIADFDAEFAFLLEFTSGFALKATMDPLDIGGVFQLRGAGGQPQPIIDVDLRLGKEPKVLVAGAVQLLGLQAETFIQLNDGGFAFLVSGRIFDLFEASVQASGSNLKSGGDFFIRAQMKNDLLAYLRENTVSAIQQATQDAMQELEQAQRDLTTAQNRVQQLQGQIEATRRVVQAERARHQQAVRKAEADVAAAQNKVNQLQGQIDQMRRNIQAERARHQQAVRNAESGVAAAQRKVNQLQNQINSMRRTIQAERDRDARRLADARREVQNAQNKVNSIQGEINRSKARIDQLKRDIAAKKRWYDNSGWRKSYRWAEYSAYVTAKGTEITGLYGKIGTLEGAKATAWGVLEAARQVVRGMERAAKTFPIEADPRMAGLITARESANLALQAAMGVLRTARKAIVTFPIEADPRMAGLITAKESASLGLEAAKGLLRAARAAIVTFPIEADPRMAGLITAKESANIALQGAKGFLEGVKVGLGGFEKVSTFIVEAGLGGLVDVREAQFEGQLNVVKGGLVNLFLKMDFMKQPHALQVAFNFHSPLDAVKVLADRLLDSVK